MIKDIDSFADSISESVNNNYTHGVMLQSDDIYNLYIWIDCTKGVRK